MALAPSATLLRLKPSADQEAKRAKMRNGSSPAQRRGQDLMRGEHVVGGLTWTTGAPRTDDTSRKILAAGRKPGPRSINTQDPVLSIKGDDFTGLGAHQSGTSIFTPFSASLPIRGSPRRGRTY